MIKKILFISSLFCAGFVSAQTFQLMDHNDVDITSTTHYEYGSATTLGATKFHVKNLTGAQQSFAIRVEKIYVPSSSSGLAVCFGTACYSASATVSGTQIINNNVIVTGEGDDVAANAIYTNLKVSPVTWPWNTPASDSAVWRVTVFDENNPSDSASSLIIWKVQICGDINSNGIIDGSEIAGDQNQNGMIDGSEIAGDITCDGEIGGGEIAGDLDASSSIGSGEIAGDVNGSGDLDGNEKEGDINGNGVIDNNEIHGDTNGNGIIDNGEVAVSVNEISKENVKLSAYPNPATNDLIITYSIKGGFDNAVINIYDVLGQKVISRDLNNAKGQINLNIGALNAGLYFYAINVDSQTIRTERVIVQ